MNEFVAMDTTPAADDVQLEVYRRLGGAGRVATMFRLNDMVRRATMAGIRRRHPEYGERHVEWAWQRLTLGEVLLREAFPDREPIEP